MAKNMSFSLTTDQVRRREKTVTRRRNWWQDKNGRRLLAVGDQVNACVKVMGRKAGEPIEKICDIEIVSIRRERLSEMIDDLEYGLHEAAAEGFSEMTGAQFVSMFCDHMGGEAEQEITRIEFKYLEG